jgi:hypothetical protein
MKRIFLLILTLANSFALFGQLAPVQNEQGKFGYFDSLSGKKIDYLYYQAHPFMGNEALVNSDSGYQVITKEGKVLHTFPYYDFYQVKEGLYTYLNPEQGIAGTVKPNGEVLTKIKFDRARQAKLIKGMWVIIGEDDKLGFFSMRHGLILPMEYETNDINSTFKWDGDFYFDSADVFCLRKGSKWGVLNAFGKDVLPFEYDHLRLQDGVFGALKNNKWALIEPSGKEITPYEYDGFLGRYGSGAHMPRSEDPFIFLKDGKVVFYNLSSNKVVPAVPAGQYDWQVPQCMIVHNLNKYGIIDPSGKIILLIEYDRVQGTNSMAVSHKTQYIEVCKENKCGVFVPNIGFKAPLTECEGINEGFVNGKLFYCLKKNRKKALYNSLMKPLTGFDYSQIDLLSDKISAEKEGVRGSLSVLGVFTAYKEEKK